MAIIPLGQEENIVTQPEQSATVTNLTIVRLVIIPEQKKVRVLVAEFPKPILLLSGDAYDAYMGQAAPLQIMADLVANIQAQIAGAGLTFE